ncbi:MAG: hypothetical protein ACOY8P_01685 [Thermodesulfobacteriota bacterium]
MAKLKFPHPGECKQKDRAMMCPADRVLGLFNQETSKEAKRIGKTVRTWFTNTAHNYGWAGVMFVKQVGSQHGAGCVLARPPEIVNAQIIVTKKTLVLTESEEDK